MKKTLITLGIFALLILSLAVSAAAVDRGVGDSSLRSVSLHSYPDKTVYGAFEQLDTAGLELLAIYSDGSRKIISGKDIRVSYLNDNCMRVGDDAVIISYGGKSINLPVTVNRIAYDLSALQLTGFTTIYNGEYQSYASLIPRVVGLDGIALTVNAVGGGVNAGEYDISIDFSTESRDYLLPESRVITMTVEPARAEIVWSGLSFTYDGRSKAPTAYYTDVNGARVYPTVIGAATNAGTSYTARAMVNDPNYIFSGTTVGYEIKKADYDFSGVVWSQDSFTYDGSKKSISLSGLPAGVSITGYTGDRGSDAGIYTAVAMLAWDEKNYNPPSAPTHTWEIKKADYDMSGVRFEATEAVYDGRMHYPTLVGIMPTGADGIALEYSFSAGAAHVSDGVVSVMISFSSSSKNYNIPEARHSSVNITPLGISVIWGNLTLEYSGTEQAPEVYAEECAVNIDGKRTAVGKYTATATTENTDYYIINDKAEYSIIRAKNAWSIQPSSSTCYEGKEIALVGQSKFGEVIYTFYADAEGEMEISRPTACGKYYARLSVMGTDNYEGLESEIISFEIVEIVAVSFLGVITKDKLCAFDKFTPDDLVCSVLNNDGSIDYIDAAAVTVIYEHGDSLRRADKTVVLKYRDFTLTLPVEVDFADYDMSSVRWENISQTYDGGAKRPTLTGLPKGVRIESYLGNDMISAGSYRVYVRLSYDSENYNEPKIAPCEFTIDKCTLPAPYISVTYNGEIHLPVSDSPLYTVKGEGAALAGVYTVSAELTDSHNYEFSGGKASTAAIFEILPATLTVSVSDVKLKLFERISGVEYSITDGVIFGGDIVEISPYAEGNRILLKTDNPNYVLDVDEGRIIRLPYPTAEGFLLILSVILLLLLLIFIGLKLYRSRYRLATVGAALKCRWHNRYYKADPPKADESSEEAKKTKFAFELKAHEDTEETSDTEADIETEEGAVSSEDEQIEGQEIIEFEIDADKADTLITDSLARSLIKRDGEIIYSEGSRKAVMSVEDIGKAFLSGQRVDVNRLKEKKLVPPDTAYLKVLGGGRLDKPLSIYANEFSLCAVKMIALTGGQAIKTVTMKSKAKDEKE